MLTYSYITTMPAYLILIGHTVRFDGYGPENNVNIESLRKTIEREGKLNFFQCLQ